MTNNVNLAPATILSFNGASGKFPRLEILSNTVVNVGGLQDTNGFGVIEQAYFSTDLITNVTARLIVSNTYNFSYNGYIRERDPGATAATNTILTLIKDGPATQTLASASAKLQYTGGTLITNGTLQMGAAYALPNGAATAQGGGVGANCGLVVINTNAILDLANNSVHVNGLMGYGIVNNTVAGTPTLFVGTNNMTSGPLYGQIRNTAGSLNLTKVGTGVFTVGGTNTYTGNTLVSGGTLSLTGNGYITNSPIITVNSGCFIDGSTAIGGWLVASNQTFNDFGTVTGSVTFASGSIFNLGNPGTVFAAYITGGIGAPGSSALSGSLTLGGGTVAMDIGNDPSFYSNDVIVVSGRLNLTGTTRFNFTFINGAPQYGVPYTLIRYFGRLTGAAANLSANLPGATFDTSNPGLVNVTFTAPSSANTLTWLGDGTLNAWDTASLNWTNIISGTVKQAFSQGDAITFDDNGSLTPYVNLTSALLPGSVTVSNSGNYFLGGNGSLSGPSGLTKGGTGILTISNLNGYTGTTLITNGIVRPARTLSGSATALGSVYAPIIVTNNGTLDVYQVDLGGKPLTVSGTGYNGMGAIDNSLNGNAGNYSLKTFILAGDTTFGASGGASARYDVRSGSLTCLNGQPFNITKIGPGLFIWTSATIDTNLANITVLGGFFGTEQNVGLGNTASNLFMGAGTTFRFYNSTAFTKNIWVTNGTTFNLANGTSITPSPIVLATAGTNLINGGNTLNSSGPISGPGSLVLNGGTVILSGTNTYTGGALVMSGIWDGTTYGLTGNITNNAVVAVDQTLFDGTLNATLYGAGFLWKTNAGTVYVMDANLLKNATGTNVLAGGMWAVGVDNAFASSMIYIRGNGAGIRSADTTPHTITNNIWLDNGLGTSYTFGSTNLTNNGLLTFTGPGTNANGNTAKTLIINSDVVINQSMTGGTSPLAKTGPGTLTLGGTNSITALTNNQGIVRVSATGVFTNTVANMVIAPGAQLDVAAITGYTNKSGSTLIAGSTAGNTFGPDIKGNLVSTGAVNIAGTAVPATLGINGNLTLGGGTIAFDLGTGGNDLITNSGVLTLNGTTTLQLTPLGALTNGVYRLITASSISGTGLTLSGTNNLRETFVLAIVGGVVQVTVSGVPSGAITWKGTVNTNWDVNATANWLNGGIATAFTNADSVLFDATAILTNIVTPVTVLPSLVTIDNTYSNFLFSGVGKISGSASIVKFGPGLTTMNLTNDFIGNVVINNGIYRAGSAGALGSTTAGAVYLTNGSGTLDINNFIFGTRQAYIAGAGYTNGGALSQFIAGGAQGAFRYLTLTAPATIGNFVSSGVLRWEIGRTAPNLLSSGGQNYKLTKIGTNEIHFVALTIDPGFGDIDVLQGDLWLETTTTPTLGDPTKTLTVFGPTGRLALYQIGNLSKNLVLTNGGILYNNNTAANISAPITLLGSGIVDTGGATLTESNIISGAGVLVKNGANSLILLNTNTYTGGTLVNGGGTLQLGNGVQGGVVLGPITNNGTVYLWPLPGPTMVFPNTVTGTGGITKDGTNALNLDGNLLCTGNFAIQNGLVTLTGTSGNQIADTAQVTVNNGGILDLYGNSETIRALAGGTANLTMVTNSQSAQNVVLTLLNPNGAQTFSGSIGGNITVVSKDSQSKNNFVQALSAGNTYYGKTIIDNGQIRINNDSSLGAVPLSFQADNVTIKNGGVLQNNNAYVYLHPNRGIYLAGGDAVLAGYAGFDWEIQGVISGPGRLLKYDSSRVILAAANTFTGDTTSTNTSGVVQGGFKLAHPLALQYSTFDASGLGSGPLDLGDLDVVLGGLKGAGSPIQGFNGAVQVGNNNQSTFFGGNLTGTGQFIKIGAGRLVLTGNIGHAGGTVVNSGALVVNGLLSGTGAVTVNAGGILGGYGSIAGPVTAGAGGTIDPGSSVGTLTISNSLTANNASFLFELGGATTPGSGVNDLVDVKGDLNLSGLNAVRFLFLNGSPATSGYYTIIKYSGALVGSAANLEGLSRYGVVFDTTTQTNEVRVTFTGSSSNLTWLGDGVANIWNVNGAQNWTNGVSKDVFLDGDNVTFDNSGSNNVAVNIASLVTPNTLTVNADQNYEFAGAGKIASASGLLKLGLGTLKLSNTNGGLGTITVGGGTLAVSVDDNLGAIPINALAPSLILTNGGSLMALNTLTIASNRSIALGLANATDAGAIAVATGSTLTYAGIITNNGATGVGTLVKTGLGALALSGANTYSGGTTNSQGALYVRSASALGTGAVTLGDGNSGTDGISLLLDTASVGMLTNSLGITVASGSGVVTLGSTPSYSIVDTNRAVFTGPIALNRDVILQTGAGTNTAFLGAITGTGNLFITNASRYGDQRGNSANRVVFEGSPKTFAGTVTVRGGLATNFTVFHVNASEILSANMNVSVEPNAVFRLNGTATIGNLNGGGYVRGVASASVLSVNSGSLNGVMQNDPFDGGSLALTKVGTGTMILNNTNPYTGDTRILGGTLMLGAGASISNSPNLYLDTTLDPTATLDVSAVAGGFNLAAGQSLIGAGTVNGYFASSLNNWINPGGSNNIIAGGLVFNNDVSFASGTKFYFDLDTLTTSDSIVIKGNPTFNGTSTVYINPVGALQQADYPLFTYYGTSPVGGAGNLAIVIDPNSRAQGSLVDVPSANPGVDPGYIMFTVTTPGAQLTWIGTPGNNLWDFNTTYNWNNLSTMTADTFFQGDTVLFNSDSGLNTNITIVGAMAPSTITLNSSGNFYFFGTGKITGSGKVLQQGTGTNTFATTNDYSGGTIINAGLLRFGATNALGWPIGTNFAIIAAGASLDLNGVDLLPQGAKTIVASGLGIAANIGAIANTGTDLANRGMRRVLLTGNTAIGNDGNRFDITEVLNGGGYDLIKIGNNRVSLDGPTLTGIANVHSIIVSNGALETHAQLNGAPVTVYSNANFTIWSGANMTFSNSDVTLNAATFQNASTSSDAWLGQVYLNGATNLIYVDNAAGRLTNRGAITGNSLLTKSGPGIWTVIPDLDLPGGFTNYQGTACFGGNATNSWYTIAVGATNQIGAGGASGMLYGPVTNYGTLQFNRSDNIAWAGTNINSTNGIFIKLGNNNLTLTDTNRYLGPLIGGNPNTVGAGTLTLGLGSMLHGAQFWVAQNASTGMCVVNGGTLVSSDWIAVGRNVAGATGEVRLVSGSIIKTNANHIILGSLGGTGTLTVNGGTLTNTGLIAMGENATGVGYFNLNGGLAQTRAIQKYPPGAPLGKGYVRFNGGTLQPSGTQTNISFITADSAWVQSGGLILDVLGYSITNGQALIFDATSTGGGMTKLGLGDFWSSSTNTFTGDMNINQGAVLVGTGNISSAPTGSALGNPAVARNVYVNAGATLGLLANAPFGPSSVNPAPAFTLNIVGGLVTNNINVGMSTLGPIVLNGGTLQGGNGQSAVFQTMNFVGNVTTVGGLPSYISGLAGTYNAIHLGNLVTNAVTFNTGAGSDLFVNASFMQRNTGQGGGAGALIKTGLGTMVLDGNNYYTGPTYINQGSLLLTVNGTIAGSSTGAVLVAGGTLGGVGFITNSVVVLPGGTLSPGSNNIGILTVKGNVKLGGTTEMKIKRSAGLFYKDLLTGVNTQTNGGTLTVTVTSDSDPLASFVAGDAWKLFNATTTVGAFAVTNLPGPLAANLVWDTSTLNTDGTLRVAEVASNLVITPSPTNTVEVGNPVGFLASASGSSLTYRWYANSNFAAVVYTGPDFTNPVARCVNNGDYYNVTVSNAVSAITNAVPVYVAVTDTNSPAFVTDLVQATNITGVGSNFTLTVSMAASCHAPAFMWFFNTNNVLTNAVVLNLTNSTLTLTNLQVNESGKYMVTVTNINGATNSMEVTLVVTNHSSVAMGLIITPSPTNTVDVGNKAEFTATVTGGTVPIDFYWYKLPNLTAPVGMGSSYTSAVVTCLSEGDAYHVVASNIVGLVTSAVAYVEVRDLNAPAFNPAIVTTNVTLLQGTNFSVTVGLAASCNLPTYRWYLNATNLLASQTTPTLSLANLKLNDGGIYTLIVSNQHGLSGIGTAAVLTVSYLVENPMVITLGTTFQTTVTAEPNRAYWLEARDSLTEGSWTFVIGVTNVTGPQTLEDAAATGGFKFYRIGSAPAP
ncbi:MAG: autotransporter-associated beta strand repeat-containing protein [Verrucomicrobiota bacterium]